MKKIIGTVLSLAACATLANAANAYKVKNEFELPKDTSEFEEVEVGFNVDLTFGYQGLSQEFTPAIGTAKKIQSGLSLPTANFDINAKVMKGFNVKLETMLSSHHHHETYVKGGYASIDNLDFVDEGFAQGFMSNATIKVGVNDINFGDAHFRRTDNADVFRSPFVLNMAVEPYMQAGFVELLYRMPSVNSFVNFGITNGQVDPDDTSGDEDGSGAYGYYGKVGYDKQINDDLRFRITESIYNTSDSSKNSLYGGDKAGAVATRVFDTESVTSDFGPTWNALSGYSDLTVSLTNTFIKYRNTELFAGLEFTDGNDQLDKDMKLFHYNLDLVQRFGRDNRFYAAARYESAETEKAADTIDNKLTQYQLTMGWYLSKNAMAKLEYVKQEREGFSEYVGGKAEFDGFMLSTALSF